MDYPKTCETCFTISTDVKLRSSDQNLCENCEEERNQKVKQTKLPKLNMKAKPLLPWTRSRSIGAIFARQDWASPITNPPSSDFVTKSNIAVQDGVHKNNEIAVATIMEDFIAKWSIATKSPTLKRLQELCRERKIKVSGSKKELNRRLGLASKHRPEMEAEAKNNTEGQATMRNDTDEVQPPATFTQNQKQSLTVKLPLQSSIPGPFHSEHDYETDDEE